MSLLKSRAATGALAGISALALLAGCSSGSDTGSASGESGATAAIRQFWCATLATGPRFWKTPAARPRWIFTDGARRRATTVSSP